MKFIVIFVLLVSSFISNSQGNVPTLPPQAKSHAVKFAPVPPANTNVNLFIMPYCAQNYFYVVNTGDSVTNISYTVMGVDGGFIWGGIIPTMLPNETKMVLIPSGGLMIFVNVSGKSFVGTC